MASRVALDGQGRLILRENGKIILPYEHFANAVMLKHMNGPHGLHLGLEGTIRAVSGYINIYVYTHTLLRILWISNFCKHQSIQVHIKALNQIMLTPWCIIWHAIWYSKCHMSDTGDGHSVAFFMQLISILFSSTSCVAFNSSPKGLTVANNMEIKLLTVQYLHIF